LKPRRASTLAVVEATRRRAAVLKQTAPEGSLKIDFDVAVGAAPSERAARRRSSRRFLVSL